MAKKTITKEGYKKSAPVRTAQTPYLVKFGDTGKTLWVNTAWFFLIPYDLKIFTRYDECDPYTEVEDCDYGSTTGLQRWVARATSKGQDDHYILLTPEKE